MLTRTIVTERPEKFAIMTPPAIVASMAAAADQAVAAAARELADDKRIIHDIDTRVVMFGHDVGMIISMIKHRPALPGEGVIV